ncbi:MULTISPECIES: 2-amino-4-hydroxy-6-hydroxymethyldihydropteridine diphosphokinase [unclassified Lysobacter]|uniref:2-amino-4-hydroxy-6- hydroxymethyldihydropteridine diphosphokinase n=1 Tax=unclassified Lysobacter TaxID=2635362 RepID=UPI0007018064|nr:MULTISPECIES: 2-amino-4-hydroxy-6-hydroxymethyldihydropteridine diphosphokinase [unclassified Lysobacter]KRA21057.1 2-amino-4-hydroxy-6-hydroxymethyldihydropteridine pyrophosphokinase [Lysobacter sp. Root604]KRD40060.1 2-amino-4-hydroxy-6-hydroxymethyldihydropteridine pyrophosphokinase [Lysobacter sp. Root916]KRD80089.1 2-amino-4-hydroxy-6-hydroxymethyldihydropteridine pyrophosphokinase [Lysobacter sp. Root983]
MSVAEVAFVGLGSNLGDSAAILRGAFEALAALPGTRLLRASSLYRTPAWGVTAQPDFVNAAAMLETTLAPQALLRAMLAIEREAGRDRREDGSDRWGPRTLDLDLLLYGQHCLDDPGLRLPHPHLHQRAFALLPLLEIAPDAQIPGIGPARDALAQLEIGDIQTLA